LSLVCCAALLSADGFAQGRVVVTGYGAMARRVELLKFNPETGALTRNLTIADVGGVPQGAVFSRP